MIIDQRYLGQKELIYVYKHGKKRMENHPELAEKYRKMIEVFPFYQITILSKTITSYLTIIEYWAHCTMSVDMTGMATVQEALVRSIVRAGNTAASSQVTAVP